MRHTCIRPIGTLALHQTKSKELRLFCPSRASEERCCITLPVADWAAQTEALEAACPAGAAQHRQTYLRVGLAQNPTPGSLPLQTSSGGTRCLPPHDSSSVCLQSPGLAQTIELTPTHKTYLHSLPHCWAAEKAGQQTGHSQTTTRSTSCKS